MKRKVWILLFVLSIWLYSGTAFAHVALEQSAPEDGSTLTEPVNSIVLTFSGEILPMSTLTIVDESGAETGPTETATDEGVLTAKLAEPLPNGSYQVNWNVVAQDGHHMEGSFGFTVAVEQEEPVEPVEPQPEESEPAEPEEPAGQGDQDAAEEAVEPSTPAEEPAEPNNQGQMTSYVPYIAAAAVVVLGFFLFFILRPKRKP